MSSISPEKQFGQLDLEVVAKRLDYSKSISVIAWMCCKQVAERAPLQPEVKEYSSTQKFGKSLLQETANDMYIEENWPLAIEFLNDVLLHDYKIGAN